MTSHAKTVSSTPIEAPSPRQEFDAARDDTRKEAEASRGSEMVRNDQPKPAPKPSPELSYGPDGAAFNGAWEREQRRAAFIAMRTDPKTDGRVRTLNRDFNR